MTIALVGVKRRGSRLYQYEVSCSTCHWHDVALSYDDARQRIDNHRESLMHHTVM